MAVHCACVLVANSAPNLSFMLGCGFHQCHNIVASQAIYIYTTVVQATLMGESHVVNRCPNFLCAHFSLAISFENAPLRHNNNNVHRPKLCSPSVGEGLHLKYPTLPTVPCIKLKKQYRIF